MNLQVAQKVLLIAPHRLGDTLFATPGIRVLRQARPDIQIDVMPLSALSYESLVNNTCINKVYRPLEEPIEKLAADYDLVLPLQNIKKMQEYLHNIPNVLMLPRYIGAFHYSQNFYRFVLEHLPNAAEFPAGGYELNFSVADEQAVDKLLKENILEPKHFLLAIHMGCHKISKGQDFFSKIFPFLATKDSRSWSFSRFNKLIQRILKNHPETYILLTGSASERFAADSLQPHPHILNWMGKTNVTELAALLARCQLLVTGDTGPMHVACTVGLPMVLLCGETNPAHTGPYPMEDHHTIIHKNNMKEISLEEAYEAIVPYINYVR